MIKYYRFFYASNMTVLLIQWNCGKFNLVYYLVVVGINISIVVKFISISFIFSILIYITDNVWVTFETMHHISQKSSSISGGDGLEAGYE